MSDTDDIKRRIEQHMKTHQPSPSDPVLQGLMLELMQRDRRFAKAAATVARYIVQQTPAGEAVTDDVIMGHVQSLSMECDHPAPTSAPRN